MVAHHWQVGPSNDGQMTHHLVRDMPTVGLKAVISLSQGLPFYGSSINDNLISFRGLSFVRSSRLWPRESIAIRLANVPPVLLSEAVADVQGMTQAAGGDMQ